MSGKKTKKLKNKIDKKRIWALLDKDLKKDKNLELLFTEQTVTQRERCEQCNSMLQISDEKFMICTNSSCGIIYDVWTGQLNGDIMVQMIQTIQTQLDVVCL